MPETKKLTGKFIVLDGPGIVARSGEKSSLFIDSFSVIYYEGETWFHMSTLSTA